MNTRKRKSAVRSKDYKTGLPILTSYRWMLVKEGEFCYAYETFKNKADADAKNEREWSGKAQVMTVKEALEKFKFFKRK